jgi:TolB-like protein/Flp pilus assembly protein TadD
MGISTEGAVPLQPDLPVPAILEQVRRIVASTGFASSERMIRLLRFAVEYALAGRSAELKEYLLGVEVFDRRVDFDPRTDPIVRVEARRFRAKLKTYYETEGRDDQLLIEFPTGAYVPRFRMRGSAPPNAPGTSASTNIAVLPFTNLSTEPDSEYFSDGLTEELIHGLTRVDGLQVVAWNSAVQLKNHQDDFYSIGQQLRAGTILQGSVRQSGGRLRIHVRLVDTASGIYLWSETYDRRLQDLFAIQDEIARAIVSSLKIKLFGAVAPPLRSGWSLPAYDLYLRGRFQWNKRTRQGFERAIQYFNEAIAAEPSFAPGYAGLADAYMLFADYGGANPASAMPKGKAAALRALELDSQSAEAYTSLGLVTALYEWDWPQAGEQFRRAIALKPGYVTAHHWYSCDCLALQSRFDEALAEIELAAKLDPLSHVIHESVAYVLLLARRYDDALEKHTEVLELDSNYYKSYSGMGRIFIHKGMYGKAIELLLKGRAIGGDNPPLLGALGQAYGFAGQHAEARSVLRRLGELAIDGAVPSTAFAMVYIGLGEHERALEWLETACARREPQVCPIKVHPGYDALRNYSRFQALLEKIGLQEGGSGLQARTP